jgi:hypothetical protein
MIIEASHNDFKVKLDLYNYKESELIIIEKAVSHMVKAVGDPEFEIFCRNHEYEIEKSSGFLWWKKTWKEKYIGFHMSEGLTGYQVYTRLMKGAEMEPEETPEDNEADIYLKIDRSYGGSSIGYTYPSTKWQWIYYNRLKITEDWSYPNIAQNIFHEWCHKVGFEHESGSFSDYPAKKFSIPYACGYYVRDFVKSKLD